MDNHPIEGLMKTALESIKQMVDVNTVIGEAVEAPNGTVIIPVSRVSCGFVAGGGEYELGEGQKSLPFGGGSGAGVSVVPIGFLVVGPSVRFLPVETNAVIDRLLDLAPELIEKLKRRFVTEEKLKDGDNVNIEVQDIRVRQ
ncbi:MAG: GerW family sporulation protein [Clostridia bacterium]|nr:GerW family sporulation protein [Clostridia bacterium]MBC7347055.1 GerW family sporulation protein [Clostridia bacterium]